MSTLRSIIDSRKAASAAQKAQINRQNKVDFSDFMIDMRRNPMIMIGLGGSGLLTALSGLFIGLAPKLDSNGVLSLFGGATGAGAAIFGCFFAALYAIVFPVIGEWGAYYWHKKASIRDEGSTGQAVIGYSMMAITIGFMVTTAVAASVIIASLLHTFEAFQAIPDWAQKWTILIIPIALALHAIANIWYDHISKYAEERREMERQLQNTEIETENQIRQAKIRGREEMARAMANEYTALSSQEAGLAGQKLARETWTRDKKEFSGDDDGDGTPNVADSDYRRLPHPLPISDNGKDPTHPSR